MLKKLLLSLLLVTLIAMAAVSAWVFADLPDLDRLTERLHTPSLRITDRNGRLLYEALPSEGGRHNPLPVERVPSCLANATVATEDARFFQHPGVDWQGILRALWINLRGGETLAGGSTITQQVARTLLLAPDERYQPTLRRKLRESLLAFQLTRRYSKEEILALYLNQSYYGSLAYGIQAAAQTYFGKPSSQLDLAECALIAGLPQSPANYSPFVDPQAAKNRQQVVLSLMEMHGYITAEERELAGREQLIYTTAPYPMLAPHFDLMVLAQLDSLLDPEVLANTPLEVRTTLNLDWQQLAETAIQRQLNQLRQTPDRLGHNLNSAALVAIDPQTGEILTMVGSPDYQDIDNAGAINMVLAPRQPGSALKPILYAAAFDPAQPQPWTAATALLDVRTSFVTHEGDAYVPVNYDQREHGPVLAREALASSLNIPAALTMQHVGVENFLHYAARFGLDRFGSPDDYDLSLALGGGEVRLLDLTAAYAVFANRGQRVTPFAILEVRDASTNRLIYTHSSLLTQPVLDPRLAWLISDILADNDARSLGFGPNSILRLDRPAAVKTGTTSNFHDNWTVGYTPELVVGVWAGNPDYTPMRDVSGVSGAAPIWASFIRSALRGQPATWFEQPEGMVQVEVCAGAGLLPGPDCPYRFNEWFIDGTQPHTIENLYHRLQLDLGTGSLATPGTPAERLAERLALNLPAQALAWARAHNVLLLSEVMGSTSQVSSAASPSSPNSDLVLLSPPDRAAYRMDPTFPPEAQRLRLEVAGATSGEVTLWVDDQPFAELTAPPYIAWWQLAEGEHTFYATTENGLRSATVTIQVSDGSVSVP